MTVVIDRKIMLSNFVGENVAQILICLNPDTNEKWAVAYPFAAMHEMMRTDMSNPIIFFDAQQFMPQSFLGWIATAVRNTRNAQLAFKMLSYDPPDKRYHSILLIEGMDARDIAGITGFDLEMVQEFFRNYFVVKVD